MDRPAALGKPSPAESIFAAWLANRDEDFDALVRANKQHERELRELHVFWMRIEPLLRLAGIDDAPASFAQRLKAAHGEVGLTMSLDAPGAKPTSELVRRLQTKRVANSRYTLEGEIARGGMGAILKVFDEDLRRHLAMKVVLGTGERESTQVTPSVDPKRLARFLEEAQVTGQLDHPGIVPVHELGLDSDGRVYFTMKLVKGRDLKKIFDLVFEEQEGWNETRALGVILKVCEAMAYAHAKGVIHRDLKPANVMVGSFGEVFVMDWGLARVVGKKDTHDIRINAEGAASIQSVKTERRDEREDDAESPIVTMDGDIVGTPAYMPIEQARGEIEKLTARSDVYAIGAMLYHLLARQSPYMAAGMRVSNYMVLAMVMQGPPAALTSMRKNVPAELVAIVEKAMARDASQRYVDTLALAEDLRAYLEHRVVGAYETGAWAETRKWIKRNRPLAASLGAAFALLVLGLSASLVFKARADDQARIAKSNEARATEQEKLAVQRASDLAVATQAAQRNEHLATQKANDVLSLSAIQELKDLVEGADALWPAFPEKLAGYDRWLADAKVLIDGRAADPAHAITAHPSLMDQSAKLAEIRQRAKPLTPEQVESDRRSSPTFAEWDKTRAKLTWMRRMLGVEPWPIEAEVEAALAKEQLPSDANGLNNLAWNLIDTDPAKIVYGSEVRALILARRAVAAASDKERSGIRDTLAWALLRCGRFDDAATEEAKAIDEAQREQKDELRASLKQIQEQSALWRGETSRAKQGEDVSKLTARLVDLERDVNERRTFEFDDAQDRWWHTQLAQLVSDLKAFTSEKSGLFSEGTSDQHGWGIVRRRAEAATIAERSVSGAEAKRRWDETIAAIANSPKYPGLALTPQLGLLPIGEDPDAHLWEFAHLQTGEPAQRGADGKIILKEETGLVFVLIPTGTFWMGAQKTDPSGQNFDPQANDNESPVKQVTLDAYFMSKYEMTQGQWLRFVGHNPSNYGPGLILGDNTCSLLNPVEQVSWNDCTEALQRLGLVLPTEAQWEYGARAGTTSVWWTGDEKEKLQGAANLADRYCKTHGGPISWQYEDWLDDGWAVHARVGSYRPNEFGLHDTIGNVWEWCRDAYAFGNYALPVREGDGERHANGAYNRVHRGGSFSFVASFARSAERYDVTPESRLNSLGVRPARALLAPISRLDDERK